MRDHTRGAIVDLVTELRQTQAQFDILKSIAVSGIETTRLLEGAAPNHHAGSRDGFKAPWPADGRVISRIPDVNVVGMPVLTDLHAGMLNIAGDVQ